MFKRILIVSLSLLLITSCVKDLDISIPEGDRKLIINAGLCPDSTVSLTLGKSQFILDQSGYTYVERASILVYEQDALIDSLEDMGNGLYVGKTKPGMNKTYTIKVNAPGDISASGTCSIPELVKIQYIDASTVYTSSSRLLNCAINFTDPGDIDNYYLLKIMSADKENPAKKQEIQFTANDYLFYLWPEEETETLSPGWRPNFFEDFEINGKSHSLTVSMIYPNDRILYVQLWSINKSLFDYCNSIRMSKENPSLFFEKEYLQSNVKGGLGIVGAYTISMDSVMLK